MKKPLTVFVLFHSFFFSACHSSTAGRKPAGKDTLLVDAANPQLPPRRHNAEFRAQVIQEPVAEYKEKIDDPLNSWDFDVRLYDHQFRDLKLVSVTGHGLRLKISTLRHYVVMDHYRLVSQ